MAAAATSCNSSLGFSCPDVDERREGGVAAQEGLDHVADPAGRQEAGHGSDQQEGRGLAECARQREDRAREDAGAAYGSTWLRTTSHRVAPTP